MSTASNTLTAADSIPAVERAVTGASAGERLGVTAPANDVAAAARPSKRNAIIAAVAAVALAGAGTLWYVGHGVEHTDDAQIDGDVINVPARTSGVVTAVHFADNQEVKEGQLLAEIDPAPATAKLAQAQAELISAQASAQSASVQASLTGTNARGQRSAAQASLRGARVTVTTTQQQIAEADAQLAAAQAAFNKARLDLERAHALIAAQAVPQAQVDAAQASFDAASAQVAQARARAASLRSSTEQVAARVSEASARYDQAATVDQQIADADARAKVAAARVATAQAARDLAALELSYTKIYAPRDGVVSKRAINVGQMVTPGSGIVALVPTHDLWVTGNFKETQLEHMKVGQHAKVKVDAFGVTLDGELQSFSAATGARFTLLPPDNATGNYTKIVQRVPVRIALKQLPRDVALRPGLSVDLAIDTRN
jgi:membrane fusion protein (multidrug efflux system)